MRMTMLLLIMELQRNLQMLMLMRSEKILLSEQERSKRLIATVKEVTPSLNISRICLFWEGMRVMASMRYY